MMLTTALASGNDFSAETAPQEGISTRQDCCIRPVFAPYLHLFGVYFT